MGANIAGIYGAQIFRNDDRPRYRRAFAVACTVLAVGLLLAIFRFVEDRLRRRRKARNLEDSSSEDGPHGIPIVPSEDVPAPIVDTGSRR